MKSIEEFFIYLANLDVKLYLEDNSLVCDATEEVLTPTLRSQLAERKGEIMAFLNRAQANSFSSRTISAVARDANLPLSFSQQRLWFIEQMTPNTAQYNLFEAVRLEGQLNIAVLEKSVNQIIQRHEILRTNFKLVEEQPVQKIAPSLELTLPLIDLRSLEAREKQAKLLSLANDETMKPFNLSCDPLLRITLIHVAEAEYVVLLTIHHIISDAWSIGIFIQELTILYEAFSQGQLNPLPELPIQYADFAIWQRQWLKEEVLDKQLSYWKQQLKNHPPVLQLPTDRPRPKIKSYQGAKQSFAIPIEIANKLKALTQQAEATLFMTLLAAFNVLLYRYSLQEDIVVGSVIANRNRRETERLIGFFVNTLVLRTNLAGNPSFRELLMRVKQVALAAYEHQDLPLEKLVEELNLERDLSYDPLFQVMFVLQNTPDEELDLGELNLTFVPQENSTAKFDLTLNMFESDSNIDGEFEYNTDLFDQSTIAPMTEHFISLLSSIVENPEQPITQLPLLTATEKGKILREWNDTTVAYPKTLCFHQLFEAQVERTPEAVAVVFQDQKLTYKELNQRANQLAHHLQKLGVTPEFKIGLCVERSLEMIIGVLGILKAGGAYLPLDPTYPAERLEFMLADSQVSILLTSHKLIDQLPQIATKIICLDTEDLPPESSTNPDSQVTIQNLAYLIYTSGSTGTPKGVLVSHEGLVNLTQDKIRTCQVRGSSRILQFFSLSFDASIPEIVMALGSGAALYLGTPTELLPGQALLEFLRHNCITHITIAPSALAVLPATELPDLEMVLVGGEAPTPELITQWSQGKLFINAYGPTETTVNASMVPCGKVEGLLPTVRPSANKQLYILDANLQLLPVGIPGELHIAGIGLARGYLNRPQKTATTFIPHPFSSEPGSRLYKTGDSAYYLSDGRIQLLGRLDHQVKIRGFRIEPGEIEARLNQHPAVQESMVIVREDIPGDKQLVAYLVAQKSLVISELHRFIADKLPKYMIPSAFIILDSFPLNPNGKVDRAALPKPDSASSRLAKEFVAPRNATEEVLAQIFAEILEIEQVGVYDNFFDLGGHSLLITKLISRLLNKFNLELSVIDLFEEPTVEGLAERILTIKSSGANFSNRDRQIATLLNADAILDSSIQPQAIEQQLKFSKKAILLTGATGFVGAFLLNELLQQTSASIHCLVRADTIELAWDKLENTLKSYLLWQETFRSRIIPVVGDLSQPLLGLEQQQFQELATQIQAIYHNGAWVHHALPYSILKDTNVLGTQEILRLACQGQLKPVHFISATSVFPERSGSTVQIIHEQDSLDNYQVPLDGYSQSKWVAEKLVRAAGDRGLTISIYRLGRISGHSQTGVFNNNDYLYRLIIGSVQLGTIPQNELIQNLIPVDYAVSAIIHLSQQQNSEGKAFHLINPQPVSTNIFFKKLLTLGYPIKQIADEQWYQQLLNIAENEPEHPLYALVPLLAGESDYDSQTAALEEVAVKSDEVEADSQSILDRQNTLNGLKNTNLTCPAINDRLLDVYFSYLIDNGFLAPPPISELTEIKQEFLSSN
ncbi:MAG: amino acid adenylation domain-containing protein [Cyanobacteria bacterium P01_F01_bin.143]